MARRGDGIGIEVTDGYVRAVRCAHDVTGQVAAAIDLPRAGWEGGGPEADDHSRTEASNVELVELLVQVAVAFGDIDDVPARIAWFPGGSALRAVNVSDARDAEDGDRVDAARQALADDGAAATLVVDSPHGSRVLGFRWDLDGAGRIAELARAAGFHDPEVEPAPLSLARAAPGDVCTVEVTVGRRRGWSAMLADRVPVLAASNTPGSLVREAPALVISAADPASVQRRGVKVGSLLQPAAIADTLQVLAADGTPLRSRWSTGGAGDGAAGAGTSAGAEPDSDDAQRERHTRAAQPSRPRGEHVDRPERYAVALGAALAAARLVPARPLSAGPPSRGSRTNLDGRPWAVERRADPPTPTRQLSWWRRALQALRRRSDHGRSG